VLTLWTKSHAEGHWAIQFFKITHTILITVYSKHQTTCMWPSVPDINQMQEKPEHAVCSCLTYIYVNTVTTINMRISGSENSGCKSCFVCYHLQLIFTVYISNKWQHQSATFIVVSHLKHFCSSLSSWGVSTTTLKAHVEYNLQPISSAFNVTVYFTDKHLNFTVPLYCLSSKRPSYMKFYL
jgi:hypothetical protein